MDGGKRENGTKREIEQHVSMFHQSLAAPLMSFFFLFEKHEFDQAHLSGMIQRKDKTKREEIARESEKKAR